MSSRTGVLLVTTDPRTEGDLVRAIRASETLEPAGVCAGVSDLVGCLEHTPTRLAIIDIDGRPAEMLRALDRITVRFKDTRFVVLSHELRNDLVLEAMQSGARHFLTKESVGAEMVSVLQRLVPDGTSAWDAGVQYTVLGVSGGCGGTTIAVNFANEVQVRLDKPALLIDLDASYGAVGTYLDLKAGYGVSDVLGKSGQIDAELVRSTSVAFSDKLRVLASPATVDFATPGTLDLAALDEALQACKSAYPYTVVDAPRVPMDIAASLARSSRQTLLVLQLSVKDVRMAKAMWGALSDRGVARDRVTAVVNRYRKWGQMVTLREVEKALPDVEVRTIRNDYRCSMRSMNFGQPLSATAPKSKLRRGIQDLVASMVEVSREKK